MKHYLIPIYSQEKYQKIFLELKYLFIINNKNVNYQRNLNYIVNISNTFNYIYFTIYNDIIYLSFYSSIYVDLAKQPSSVLLSSNDLNTINDILIKV